MSSYRIRPAAVDDLDRIVEVTLEATRTQPLYKYIFPHLEQHADDTYRHWKLLIEPSFCDPESMLLLAENDQGQVVGWVEWEWKAKVTPPSAEFPTAAVKTLQSFAYPTQLDEAIWVRKDNDPQRQALWVKTKSELFAQLIGKGDMLYLSALYVAPENQGEGVGTKLLNAGLELAARSKLEVGLMATDPASVQIYKHWGFIEIKKERLQRANESDYVDIWVLWYS